MKEIIHNKLKEIEERENIEIILAVESGSRAWGFESPDSDYDVRFIYARRSNDYLKLEGVRDVIEWQLDDMFDINGWDIQKALKLLYKSNPTLFEWCTSPIIYHKISKFEVLNQLLPQYFSKKKSLYHYWHMAMTNYRNYLKDDMVKAKKYFYVLRPILAGKWIVNQGTNPPMKFNELLDKELPHELRSVLNDLLDKKMNAPELELIPKIHGLNDYIEESIPELELSAKNMNEDNNSWNNLNKAFKEIILE